MAEPLVLDLPVPKERIKKKSKANNVDLSGSKRSLSLNSILTNKAEPSDEKEDADFLVQFCEQYLLDDDKNKEADHDGGRGLVVGRTEDGNDIVNPFEELFPKGSLGGLGAGRKMSVPVTSYRSGFGFGDDPVGGDMFYYENKTLPRAAHQRKVGMVKKILPVVELPQIRFRIREPSNDNDNPGSKIDITDGTESVSSFVAMNPNKSGSSTLVSDNASNSTTREKDDEEWSVGGDSSSFEYEPGDYSYYQGRRGRSPNAGDKTSKDSFVNKCVSRVKNLVGGSNSSSSLNKFG